jgi:AcrR family transcriptional regulator
MRNSAGPNDAPSTRSRWKRQVSGARLQPNEEVRLKLIEAAGKMIGKYGYAGCSIARVTARAKIAHGAFYLNFASQQDLFDAVLPTLGASMLHEIGQAIQSPKDIIDLERRGFKANFEYLTNHPYLYRVLSEAELYAPAAFQQHLNAMVTGYVSSLRRSRFLHYIDSYSDDELEAIATMLIGARAYLLMRYGVVNNAVKPLPPGKLEAYLKFVSHGLAGLGHEAAVTRSGPSRRRRVSAGSRASAAELSKVATKTDP